MKEVRSMKVMSPVSSLSTARMQILAGADEIYVGLDYDTFQNVSFSGRGRFNNKGKKVSPSLDELKEIVILAHDNGVIVNFAANTSHMSQSKDDTIEREYQRYVKAGLEAGVDQIIVGDIGNLLILNEMKVNKKIVASVFLATFNIETIQFWKTLGVTRVVLPHHVLLEEIKMIKENVDIEIEIFAGVGCSNIDGSCCFLHNCGENCDLGIPCKARYQLENGMNLAVLDSTLDCLLCNLKDLYDLGIDVVKIIGRDQDIAFTSAMTKIHKEFIEKIKDGKAADQSEIHNYLKQIPWWTEEFCKKNKCKFKSNYITKSFI
ncbi:U32 family peptidase [Clostridium sp. SHJSY1]|uniref:peptidase U32 family protein n=1 Tax=Clostridium sp. SHJSY1 TaxID=2942483 RepID=UPI0028770EB5|nr:peptidase U32 family protein [Clostridium sp. SHJSY1]MDS0527093.1 U32 family peptidase [Clostridium sp. SHJSY1]